MFRHNDLLASLVEFRIPRPPLFYVVHAARAFLLNDNKYVPLDPSQEDAVCKFDPSPFATSCSGALGDTIRFWFGENREFTGNDGLAHAVAFLLTQFAGDATETDGPNVIYDQGQSEIKFDGDILHITLVKGVGARRFLLEAKLVPGNGAWWLYVGKVRSQEYGVQLRGHTNKLEGVEVSLALRENIPEIIFTVWGLSRSTFIV